MIAIIGVLVALLLPQFKRHGKLPGAANVRTTCDNCRSRCSTMNRREKNCRRPESLKSERIRNFGVDIFNPLAGMRFSWIVEILPFMEEQSLFDKFDHKKSIMFQDQNPQATSNETCCVQAISSRSALRISRYLKPD